MTITVRTISNHGGDFRCSATCTVANGLKLPHQFALGHVAADAAPHLRSGRRSVALGKPLRSQAASGMGAPLCSATEALNWHYKFTNFIFSKQNKTKKTCESGGCVRSCTRLPVCCPGRCEYGVLPACSVVGLSCCGTRLSPVSLCHL